VSLLARMLACASGTARRGVLPREGWGSATAAGATTSSADARSAELNRIMHTQVGLPGGGALIQLPLLDVVFNQKKVAGSIVGGRADMQASQDPLTGSTQRSSLVQRAHGLGVRLPGPGPRLALRVGPPVHALGRSYGVRVRSNAYPGVLTVCRARRDAWAPAV
jgi:hypothetical protein